MLPTSPQNKNRELFFKTTLAQRLCQSLHKQGLETDGTVPADDLSRAASAAQARIRTYTAQRRGKAETKISRISDLFAYFQGESKSSSSASSTGGFGVLPVHNRSQFGQHTAAPVRLPYKPAEHPPISCLPPENIHLLRAKLL